MVVGGAHTAQSASVDVVVAPALKLKAVRVIGPVNHFNVTVQPAADGMPIVLQRLVGKRWKNDRERPDRGRRAHLQRRDPGERRLEVADVRPRVHKYGESTSKVRPGHDH